MHTKAHTKGPWKVEMPDTAGDGFRWIMAPDETVVATVRLLDDAWSESAANAQVISASPILLAALRPFAEIDHCGIGRIVSADNDEHNKQCDECQRILAARAAIARATLPA